jgi:response regulator RpfG family c-di-GMP phosphodiesterase
VVHTYIDALPRTNVTRLAFENATDWERTSPTVNTLAQMLGLTDAQVDDLFIAASQVSA